MIKDELEIKSAPSDVTEAQVKELQAIVSKAKSDIQEYLNKITSDDHYMIQCSANIVDASGKVNGLMTIEGSINLWIRVSANLYKSNRSIYKAVKKSIQLYKSQL